MPLTLPVRSDLEIIYGATNIAQWADADNDKDQSKIANRITWAVDQGQQYVVGRISKRFNASAFSAYPAIVFSLIARRAGIELYASPRGFVDGDPATAAIRAQDLKVETQIDQILAGQLPLVDIPVEQQPTAKPGINNSTACIPRLLDGRYINEQWTGEPICCDDNNFYISARGSF